MIKFNNKTVKKIYAGDEQVNHLNDDTNTIFQYIKVGEPTPVPYEEQYLTIESTSDNNNIIWHTSYTGMSKTISASTDNGDTWTEYTSTIGGGTMITTLNNGEKLLIKGTNAQYANSTSQYNNFLVK